MQMVRDLDLSGDELERIEVPRGMYDPGVNGGPSNGTNGMVNGNSNLHRPVSHTQIPMAVTNGRVGAHRR